jgi:hypothetical protein
MNDLQRALQNLEDTLGRAAEVCRKESMKYKRHFHVRSPEQGDLCAECGLDLRDRIHLRIGDRA